MTAIAGGVSKRRAQLLAPGNPAPLAPTLISACSWHTEGTRELGDGNACILAVWVSGQPAGAGSSSQAPAAAYSVGAAILNTTFASAELFCFDDDSTLSGLLSSLDCRQSRVDATPAPLRFQPRLPQRSPSLNIETSQ